MTSLSLHPTRPRAALFAASCVLALIAATPVAQAAPDDSPGQDDDVFGESAWPEDARTEGVPTDPMSWPGMPLDPADIPKEWLVTRPAEKITPATPEQLMNADDGLIGLGLAPIPAPHAVPAPPTKPLPDLLDAAPPWQYSYSCDPTDRPGMLQFANLVATHYDRPTYYTSRACKFDSSQHYEGRAVDWTMDAYDPQDKAIGDSVAQWLTANNGEMARRFGVQSVIWNRRAWYLYSPGYWRDYNGPSPHTDHLHISFSWDGAMGRTSWWDGTPVTSHDYGTCRVFSGQFAPRYTGRNLTPCTTNLPNPPYSPHEVVLPGMRKPDLITLAQRYLGFSGSDVDGSFGPATLAALLSYQTQRGLYYTGVLDNQTWAKMIQVGFPSPGDPAPGEVGRFSGSNRYDTAAKVAATYPVGKQVFVTTGANYPDALAVAARSGMLDAPVLLTKKRVLPAETRAALQRLQPSQITVVGGTGVITKKVLDSMRPYTSGSVRRLGGSDRYETAGLLAREFPSVPVVYVSTGASFPSALVAAARAGHLDGPVLLTRKDSLPAATVSAMQAISPYRVVVVGNRHGVSEAVAQQLRGLTTSDGLQRVSGTNRYDTAANLAGYYSVGSKVKIVNGGAFPDALTSASVAARDEGPVLMVKRTTIPSETRAALARLNPDAITIIGGNAVVDESVREMLEQYVG